MTYAAFLALCEREPVKANAMCAEAMGWELSGDGSTWCCDGECLRGIEEWEPITDRNHAAMMVGTVADGGISTKQRFRDSLAELADHWPPRQIYLLLLPPSLIAYCALVALKEAPCQRT